MTFFKKHKSESGTQYTGKEAHHIHIDYSLRTYSNSPLIITPADIDDMKQIIEDLDNGEDVNGWEDGMGNTIAIE